MMRGQRWMNDGSVDYHRFISSCDGVTCPHCGRVGEYKSVRPNTVIRCLLCDKRFLLITFEIMNHFAVYKTTTNVEADRRYMYAQKE